MSAPPALPDPDALVAATLACPAVAAMSGGVLGEVATYLPGRRVRGVRTNSEGVEVHVVGIFGPSMTEIAAQVRAAVQPLVSGQMLSIHIDDLAVDSSRPAAHQAAATPGPPTTVPEPRQPPPASPR